MQKVKCIFTNTLKKPYINPNGHEITNDNSFLYPEKKLSIVEQTSFEPRDYFINSEGDTYVVTNSPIIVSCFQSDDVYIYNSPDDLYSKPIEETYGASFDTLLTSLVGLETLISEKPLKEIKSILENYDSQSSSPQETLKELDKFGNSFELNFRRNKLNNIV